MENKAISVYGNNPFTIPAEDFIISPLTSGTYLYIDSIIDGVVNLKVVGEIKIGEYTKVHGVVPGTVFHIDTTDTEFYVRY